MISDDATREPLVRGGFRYGTRLTNGEIVYAPGVTFTPAPICALCQKQLDEARDT